MSATVLRYFPALWFKPRLAVMGEAFFAWWAGLYAEPPRTLRPMI